MRDLQKKKRKKKEKKRKEKGNTNRKLESRENNLETPDVIDDEVLAIKELADRGCLQIRFLRERVKERQTEEESSLKELRTPNERNEGESH